MTTLKGIKGDQIRYLDEDPVVQGVAGGTWASGGTANTARWDLAGAGTTQNAALAFGGGTPSDTGATESYNGSNWTSVTSMNTARRLHGGSGSQTAALAAAGYAASNVANVELYNGSTWTEVTDVNSARRYVTLAVQGTTSANLLIGGRDPGGASVGYTESWNGTSWTEVNDLNSARFGVAGFGTQTAALAASGNNASSAVESWNGTSWSETTEINSVRYSAGNAGSQTAALMFGGDTPTPIKTGETEYWNGSSWTELNDMSTGRSNVASAGTATDALAGLGAIYGAVSAVTEVWSTAPSASLGLQEGMLWFNSTSQTLKGYGLAAISSGTWASGGSMNTGKSGIAGAGIQTAGVVTGGRLGPPTYAAQSQTELYDGSAWTEVNDLNTARYALSGASAGSQTATLGFIGTAAPGDVAITESWDGTNWTEVADLNTAGSNGAGFGTQTAAVCAGGDGRSYNKTESWDGTSWTEIATMNTNRAQMAGFGISTAGLIAAGDLYPVTSPTRLSVQTELWDGTSWTEVNDVNTGRRRMGQGGFGIQTSGLIAGGYTTTWVNNVESWDGTNWAEQSEIATTRDIVGAVGASAASGFIAGGGTSPGVQTSVTEEWTVDAAVVTITTS